MSDSRAVHQEIDAGRNGVQPMDAQNALYAGKPSSTGSEPGIPRRMLYVIACAGLFYASVALCDSIGFLANTFADVLRLVWAVCVTALALWALRGLLVTRATTILIRLCFTSLVLHYVMKVFEGIESLSTLPLLGRESGIGDFFNDCLPAFTGCTLMCACYLLWSSLYNERARLAAQSLALSREVEERRRTESELRYSHKRLSTVLDSLDGLVCVADLESGELLQINKCARDKWGDVEGQICWKALWPNQDGPCEFCTSENLLDTDGNPAGVVVWETQNTDDSQWHERRARAIPWIDGRMVRLSIATNVTSRKQSEEALFKKEEEERKRLTEILEGMNLGVVVINEDYDIEFINQPMADILAQRSQSTCYALDGKDAPCDAHGTDSRCAVREILQEGKSFLRYTHVTSVELDSRYFETWAYPINYAGRRCVIEVRRDVTEQTELEERLRQSQKMEAVGQLAGGIAHDFNNLLQAVLGFADLASMDLPRDDPRSEYLRHVRQAARRAAKLTQQLLAFSRRQVLQSVSLDLNKLITNVMTMLKRLIGEHIELELRLGDALGTVRADPGLLEQVLVNVCVNARDAMPDGGHLVIETRNETLSETFCQEHSWAKPGGFVHLVVTDSGIGMSPDTLERIFEPFFTTKDVGKGTGLGLPMVDGIVKQHEGLVHVASEPGHGTTLSIYLPTRDVPAESSEKRDDAEESVGGTETILLAEDEDIVRDLTARVLGRKGYTVLAAKDGEEALQVFESHEEDIDLALLDVVMPKVSGKIVCDTIRAYRPDLPILFMSGYSASTAQVGSILEENTPLIRKPYSSSALLQKVRDVLDESRARVVAT